MERFVIMSDLNTCSASELLACYARAKETYDGYLKAGVTIHLARGRPAPDQLDLSDNLLNLGREQLGVLGSDGTDCRNYGGLLGLPECRKLFGEIMGVPAENVVCGGASVGFWVAGDSVGGTVLPRCNTYSPGWPFR